MQTTTPKTVIEEAILAGTPWEVFKNQHPDVNARRWKDLKYYLRRDGKLPPAKTKNKSNQINVDDLVSAEKDRQELKQAKATINKLRVALVNAYDLADILKTGLSNLPKINIPAPKIRQTNRTPSTIILPLYDLHIGHLTNGPLGAYNQDTFISRCNTLTEDLVREIRALNRSRYIEKVVVIFGGDIIEGRTIYPGQTKESAPIQYQLTVGPEVISRNLLYPLAREVPQIDIFCLPGNHGRLGERNELDKVEDNLDMIFCHIVKLRCAGIENITWHEVSSWFSCFSLYGYSYIAVHGDGFKSWGNIPITSAIRYKDKLQNTVNNRFDVLLAGHHHSPGNAATGFSKVCLMGNWAGTSDYASTMGLGGPPSQKAILADPSSPILATYEFMLAKKEEPIQITPIDITSQKERSDDQL